jgi:hypothetical protein
MVSKNCAPHSAGSHSSMYVDEGSGKMMPLLANGLRYLFTLFVMDVWPGGEFHLALLK